MIVFLAIVLALSFAGTGWIRRYCLTNGIVDIPNQRSSHSRIVARGGGVGFSGIFLLAVVGLGIAGLMPARAATGLAGGGAIIAVTGWVDDRKGLTQVTRIVLHLAASVWAVVWLGPVPAIVAGSTVWMWVTQVAAVVAFAWLINLYNFMDGTDGIAGVEAVTVATVSGFFCMAGGLAMPGYVYWLLAAVVTGFLLWNWPPAKIFMGDAGSGFLGFTFAALTLWSAVENVRLFWPCVIPLSVFIADATTTLLRRMANGERWYEPHSSHAYQKIARRKGHLPVALGVTAINLGVLTPLAWLAWLYPRLGLPLALSVDIVFACVALTVQDRKP
jgi:Fuc2NAc and GlcNAc transferase